MILGNSTPAVGLEAIEVVCVWRVNKPQGTWNMSKGITITKPMFSYSQLAVVRSQAVKLWLEREISHENSITQWGFLIHESSPIFVCLKEAGFKKTPS